MNTGSVLRTYGTILILTLIALFLIREFDLAYPLNVQTSTRSSELAVVGEGKVDVVPDTAFVEVGITVADAVSVKEAEEKINSVNNAIVDALTKFGIDKKDIKTSNYSIYPNYSYDVSGPGRIVGYNGSVTISIKVKEEDKLPQVIQEATRAGANQVYSTRYDIEDPQKYRQEARDKAIKNAKEQAQTLAKSLGIRLGKIVNIVETTPSNGPIVLQRLGEGAGGGGAPDLQPGSQVVTSVVTLYFEKK